MMTEATPVPSDIDLSAPTHVLLLLTYRCNLRCPHCLAFEPVHYWRPEPSLAFAPAVAHRELGVPEIVQSILRPCEEGGVATVALTGGEPLLRRDFTALVEVLGRSNLDWCLDSNLARCTPEIARSIIDAGCSAVQVSVDGPERVHNRMRGSRWAYSQTMAGLDNLLTARRTAGAEGQTSVIANCVLQHGNEEVPADIVTWASEKGLGEVNFQFLSSYHGSPGFRSEVASEALREARELGARRGVAVGTFPLATPTSTDLDHWFAASPARSFFAGCDYLTTSLRIDPSGNVMPCLEHSMGNVLDRGLLDIWRGPEYREFRLRICHGPLAACERCCNLRMESRP